VVDLWASGEFASGAGGLVSVCAMAGNATSGKLAKDESISILKFTIISCSLGRDGVTRQMNVSSFRGRGRQGRKLRTGDLGAVSEDTGLVP